MEINGAIIQVIKELDIAKAKYPEWPNDISIQGLIIAEESGELMQSIMKFLYDGGTIESIILEARQTAASCIRLIENIDKLKKEQINFFKYS